MEKKAEEEKTATSEAVKDEDMSQDVLDILHDRKILNWEEDELRCPYCNAIIWDSGHQDDETGMEWGYGWGTCPHCLGNLLREENAEEKHLVYAEKCDIAMVANLLDRTNDIVFFAEDVKKR